MTIQEIYNRIELLKREVDSLRPIKPDVERKIMDKFRLDWNYNSTSIEGNALTYGETKALILYGITADGKPMKDHLEVEGHNEAVKWLEEIIKQERPLTENFIREIHVLILKKSYEVDAVTLDGKSTRKMIKIGEYKKTPNHVMTKTGEIFRFAEPEETPALMHDLIEFYRVHLVSTETNFAWLASVFHYQFIRIHPFDDGNGRMARILMNFILMQKGYPPVIIKANRKEEYISALQRADVGDLESFVVYIGSLLVQSLELMIKGAKGEEIEELEDLDKKIILLKNKIESIDKNEAIKLEKNIDSVKDVYSNSIKILTISVQKQVNKFSEFYANSSLSITGSINGTFVVPKDLTDFEGKLNSGSLFTQLNIKLALNGFKKAGTLVIIEEIWIQISFKDFFYEIAITTPHLEPITVKRLYHQQLTETEIRDYTNKVGQAIYSKIEDNIKRINGEPNF